MPRATDEINLGDLNRVIEDIGKTVQGLQG